MGIRTAVQAVPRWTARILGTMLAGLAALFAVGEGVRLQDLDPVAGSMMVAFVVAIFGMLVLWHREFAGGTMVLVGMGAFYVIEYASSGEWPGGWVLPLCFLPGILAWTSWSLEKRKPGKKTEAATADAGSDSRKPR